MNTLTLQEQKNQLENMLFSAFTVGRTNPDRTFHAWYTENSFDKLVDTIAASQFRSTPLDNGWMESGKRLPSPNQRVLICNHEGHQFCGQLNASVFNSHYMYWMPLPPSPIVEQ